MASADKKGTILVSGAAGFVGRSIAEHFRTLDGWTVRTTDCVSDPNKKISDLGDIRHLLASDDFMKGVDVYVHSMVDIRPQYSRTQIYERNATVLERALQACRASCVRMFVLISSSTVVPDKMWQRAPEELCPMPRDAYGAVRCVMEESLFRPDISDMKTVVLRPHIVLGPNRAGVFERTLKSIRHGRTVYLPASAGAPQHVVHVDDIAHAVDYLVSAGKGGVVNIGCPIQRSPYDYFYALIKKIRSSSRIVTVPHAVISPFVTASDYFGLNLFGPNRVLLSPEGFVFDTNVLISENNFSYRFSEEEAWNSTIVSD